MSEAQGKKWELVKKGGLDFVFAECNETKSIQHIYHTMRQLNTDKGSGTLKDVVLWTLTLKRYSEIAFFRMHNGSKLL